MCDDHPGDRFLNVYIRGWHSHTRERVQFIWIKTIRFGKMVGIIGDLRYKNNNKLWHEWIFFMTICNENIFIVLMFFYVSLLISFTLVYCIKSNILMDFLPFFFNKNVNVRRPIRFTVQFSLQYFRCELHTLKWFKLSISSWRSLS